jgi:hypothetical protein
MRKKHRARRHAMAVVHAKRLDDRQFEVTGVSANDQRNHARDLRRVKRRAAR